MKIKRGEGGLKPTIFPKKNRRGQFYLIAAIIIIAVIITVFTVTNYISKKETIKLFDLGEELSIESENVLDYGVYNSFNEDQMDDLVTDLTEKYADYAGEDKNLYFVFGDRQEIKVIAYQTLTEEVSISIDEGTSSPLVINEETGVGSATIPGTNINNIVITVADHEYEFALRHGENFYFVISQEISGEKHVVTGKEHYRY